jgi:hypothetical protein
VEAVTAGLLAIVHKVTGGVLVLAGLIVFPMPIPLGLIMIAIGLALLAPYFVPIQNLVKFLRRKYPSVDRTMIRLKHRCPRVIRTTIEKTNPHLAEDSAL